METKAKNTKAEVKAEVKETAKNVANILVAKAQRYLYAWQVNSERLSAKEQKQKRQKIRRQLENFYFAICLQKDSNIKKAAINEFLAFYKLNYVLQDFSIASLTDSKDSAKVESYKILLAEVQNSLKK